MELQIMEEAELFVYMVLLGALLAIVNEGLAFLRRVWHHKAVAIAIEDALFWTMAGILLITTVYQKNDGRFRGFLLLGIGLGAGIIYLGRKLICNWIVSRKNT